MYRFGEFSLDPARRELRRNGAEVVLPAKTFACVLYLVEHRDRAVGRDELMRAVWGHVHLTESVLGQAIRHARQALDDNGEQQLTIKTARGYGYRWAADVEVAGDASTPFAAVHVPEVDHEGGDAIAEPAVTVPRPRARIGAVVIAVACTAVFATVLALVPAWRSRNAAPATAGSLVLLLPVEIDDAADAPWVRLGLMDFVAKRLRASGQAVVPVDTVVGLLRDRRAPLDADALRTLGADTHADTVLRARAERTPAGWQFALNTLARDGRPLHAVAGAPDVVDAAREATDAFAAQLGMHPPAKNGDGTALQQLVQQVNAAMLDQQFDLARRLLADSPAPLRENAEVRHQLGRVAFYGHDLDAAQAQFESLLADVSARDDPAFRARILNGLAAVQATRGDRRSAEALLEQAAALLDAGPGRMLLPETAGTIWMNLGNIAQEGGRIELARERMARARQLFEGTGDVHNLAQLDANIGVLEARRERYAEALPLFDAAARLHHSVHDVAGELRALCYVADARLLLLQPGEAEALKPRLIDLLARTSDDELALRAKLSLLRIADATGRLDEAERAFEQIVRETHAGKDLVVVRIDTDVTQAERALARGDGRAAVDAAEGVLRDLAADTDGLLAENRARASIARVRGYVRQGDAAGARRALADFDAWQPPASAVSLDAYRELARAEVAVAADAPDQAGAAFERALAAAESSRIPRRVLDVVGPYVGWLRALPAGGDGDARLLRVADRVAEAAPRDYDAAMVQLAAYQRLGPPSAWRAALDRVRGLAGERAIPETLLGEPRWVAAER